MVMDATCEMHLEISFPCVQNTRLKKDGDVTQPRTLQPEFPAF